MIQETGATSDESDDGIRTITFHRKDLLHSPDFSKFGGTKKMQVVLSGRGNVVAVFIRKISISQAFNFSLASLFYTVRSCTGLLLVSLAELSHLWLSDSASSLCPYRGFIGLES